MYIRYLEYSRSPNLRSLIIVRFDCQLINNPSNNKQTYLTSAYTCILVSAASHFIVYFISNRQGSQRYYSTGEELFQTFFLIALIYGDCLLISFSPMLGNWQSKHAPKPRNIDRDNSLSYIEARPIYTSS